MRILLVHQYYLEEDDSGGSRFNEMTQQWTLGGHSVTVLAGMMHYSSDAKREEYRGKWYKRKEQQGIEVWRSYVSSAYNAGFLGRLWGYFSFVFSSLFVGAFKVRGKYDVILVTSPPLFLGITGYLLSRLKKIPFVFEIRDLWPESAIDTGVVTNKHIIRIAYWLEKFIYRKSALINVLTPAFRETLINTKKVSAKKISFIPNAADFSLSDQVLSDFDPVAFRRQKGWSSKFVIIYVGAHGVANHLEQILQTAEQLKDTNAHFVLIGSGMQKDDLKEQAQAMRLSNVEFLDPVPKKQVFKYIAASDMGASVLKRVDTFKTVYSNKTFDYMACRKPIFMAIDGVSKDLIEESGAGIFVEPENPEDFVAKVRVYINDPKRVLEEGMKGERFAREQFDRRFLAEKYLNVLKQILEPNVSTVD